MAASARMMSAGVLPSVIRNCTAVDPVIGEILRGQQCQPELGYRGLQLLHA